MFGFGRTPGQRLPVDAKARSLAHRREIAWLSEASVRSEARQHGYRLGSQDQPGISIGRPVRRGGKLYGSLLQSHVDIWGPRRGKTTSRVIPAVVEAIGPVLLTSTKRDAVDATRDVREAKGSPVFVFDPQGVAEPEPEAEAAFCWDPLAWIDPERPGAEARAAKLAAHFACGADIAVAGSDPDYLTAAEDLLAGLLLAAAVACRTIVEVVDWIASPRSAEPIELLRRSGKHWAATFVASQYQLDYRSQERLFGTALRMVSCLRNPDIHPWIVPGSRPLFDELAFLRDNGTLYALTPHERGSAAPLVSALADAIIDVAIREADRSPHGHLAVPLLAIFDDAACTARRRDLPALYPRLGPRGITAMTMLQSWSQGAHCWGPDGMADLWSAADIRVVGSGLDDIDFLHPRLRTARPGRNQFTPTDLLLLPRDRFLVIPADARPALTRALPWWQGAYAEEIRNSLTNREIGAQPPPVPELPAETPDDTEDTSYGRIAEIHPL
ncbi:TraM recognition domain-containing protein [Nocardia sp. NPDC005978]|uniref:type IV secretory system conjugative DNA transfer family protein n=1 Tax=Nocardia sp. NPDC005978 TaxID=3156725 RepID=UPI0033A3F2C7